MSVPNTTGFTLQDVKTEIEGNSSNTVTSLFHAFSMANSLGFNPSYVGNGDSLLNFRDYEHVTYTGWTLNDMTQIITGNTQC